MGESKLSVSEAIIASNNLSTRQVNVEIKDAILKDKYRLTLDDPGKLDSIAVGLDSGVEISINGNPGDFVGALNNGAFIEINGSTGRYVGNNMTSGEIIIHGSADDGVGFGTYNGTIVVNGDAGDAVGQLNKGGTILIDGSMGNLAGLYMLSGEIIVTGNAGTDTGDWMIGGVIYVAGDFETGTNAAVRDLTTDDKSKLSKLFRQYDIKAEVEDFKKIEPKELRPFYGGD